VALEYGATFPGEPRGLVLLEGGTFEDQAYMNWEETLERLSPPPLAGMPLAEFKARLRSFAGNDLLTPEVEAIILKNFEVDTEERIYPRLSRELHLKIVRAIWEQRPSQLYERVTCPVLLLPVRWEGGDDPERLAIKAREIATAEKLLHDVQVIWFDDSPTTCRCNAHKNWPTRLSDLPTTYKKPAVSARHWLLADCCLQACHLGKSLVIDVLVHQRLEAAKLRLETETRLAKHVLDGFDGLHGTAGHQKHRHTHVVC
jgi:hypothetical protein